MRKRIIYICTLSILAATSVFSACKKADEVPPRRETFTSDYVLPPPAFLSSEERTMVEEQKKEYQSLQ